MSTTRSVATVIALLIALAGQAQAATITEFTSRAAFDLAVGPTTTEDFNSFVVETPFHTIPLDVGDFTLSMTGTPVTTSGRNRIDLPPPLFSVFDVDGTNIANVLTTSDDSFFITFDVPTTAFGADFASWNDGFLRTDVVVDGIDVLTPPVGGGSTVRFYGFSSDTPFTTVRFRGLDNDGYGIDNVSYLVTSAIPEPSTLALLGIAVGALTWRRSRRKRAA